MCSFRELLKEMGVRVSQEEKSKIINGSHEIVFKIISRLKEIHQKASKESMNIVIKLRLILRISMLRRKWAVLIPSWNCFCWPLLGISG